jgi:hypothetical protein
MRRAIIRRIRRLTTIRLLSRRIPTDADWLDLPQLRRWRSAARHAVPVHAVAICAVLAALAAAESGLALVAPGPANVSRYRYVLNVQVVEG